MEPRYRASRGAGSRSVGLVAGMAAVLLVLAAARAAATADGAHGAVGGELPLDHSASEVRDAGQSWFSVGVLSGSTQPDAHLADYQWEVRPRMAWGAEALLGRGRFATGMRLWRSQTTQTVDLPGATTSPTVRMTSLDLVGRGRLLTVASMNLLMTGSVGRLHLGYHPDQVTIPSGGSGGPIVVGFQSINEWIAGGGLAVERLLGARWSVGLEVDRSVFGLDTAHRNGSVIENARESFGEWNARLEFARLFKWS